MQILGSLVWAAALVQKDRAQVESRESESSGMFALPVMHLMCVDVQCAEHLLEDVEFCTGILVHQGTQA